MKRFYIKTYGCQMNVRDSESVAALLVADGYVQTENEADADIFIANTCSVRGKAEDKALGKLHLLLNEKKDGSDRVVGVIGCMVQRLQEKLFKKLPGLDFAIGTRSFSRIGTVLEAVKAGRGPVLEAGEIVDESVALSGHARVGVTAFVNILFGCNRSCAFCIVPAVRGRERSRPGRDILGEVRSVAEAGAREVTLLGQSVMSYGRTNDVWSDTHISEHGYSEPLPRLLEAVSEIDGIDRIRFTSGHPSGCTDELVRAMSELPKVCEHMHLPVQSASDRMLKLMRRGYTVEEYKQAVDKLRRVMPEIALTTDIIVGFPSETVDDFEETRQFMNEIGFDNSFIFKYSPRPNTPAEKMDDDVSDEEKKRRNKVILEEQDITCLAINRRLIGQPIEVLVEGVSLRNDDRWAGRTRMNKIVIFEPDVTIRKGDLIKTRITRVMEQTLYGDVIRD